MTTTLELARQLLGFNTINPPGSEADCMRFLADWLDDSGFEVSLSSFGEDAAILSPACPGRRAVNRWPLPDIWIPSRWEMPAGSTILLARRWKTGVFMAADPAI